MLASPEAILQPIRIIFMIKTRFWAELVSLIFCVGNIFLSNTNFNIVYSVLKCDSIQCITLSRPILGALNFEIGQAKVAIKRNRSK